MKSVFLDTSSLLKLYHEEEGSEEVIALIEEMEKIFLCDIAMVEFSSAVWKNIRSGALKKDAGQLLIDYFYKDRALFNWIPLDDSLIEDAFDLLNQYGGGGLRSLDSLQLAAARKVREEVNLFHTSDNLLFFFLRQEGLIAK